MREDDFFLSGKEVLEKRLAIARAAVREAEDFVAVAQRRLARAVKHRQDLECQLEEFNVKTV